MNYPDLNEDIANEKDLEAAQLRKEEFYNKDNPRIQADLEDAARGLEQEAVSIREEDAQEIEEAAEEEDQT